MNTHGFCCHTAALLGLGALLFAQSAHGAGAKSKSSPAATTPLELPRIKSRGKPGDSVPIARGKVTIDELAALGTSSEPKHVTS